MSFDRPPDRRSSNSSRQAEESFGSRRRLAIAGVLAAALAALMIVWVARDRDPGEVESSGVVVVTGGDASVYDRKAAGPPVEAAVPLEREIRQDLPLTAPRDAGMTDVRMVDPERRIVCGSWAPGSMGRAPRRFVWISSLDLVVTDDGGRDFVNLVTICDGPPRQGN